MQTTVDRIASEKWHLNHPSTVLLFENIAMRGNINMIYKDLPRADYLRSIFNYNKKTGKLIWKKKTANCVKIGTEAGFVSGRTGRLQVSIKGEVFYVPRIIWKMVKGRIPNYKQIDHDDRNPLNNAWDNLSLKTQSENMKNSSLQRNNTSGIVGVNFHKFSGLWKGSISNNKKIETVYFKTMDEAIDWRRSKEREYGFHKNHGKTF